ncbi:MAG TPA: MBL fold metallo-hydrolase [Candidatus Sulfotelmatobacter sp.]|nr:MBL fold metallo-hydrolase [Candidatus Sulfotelmatobacter sp.]
MKIAAGIEMLEISLEVMGRPGAVYPTLIWDKEAVVLVDTGFPGQFPRLRAAMAEAGVPFAKLNKVIITHQDIDHIGGLPDILRESRQKVEVLAHADDKPYIQGDKPLVKSSPENLKRFESLPAEWREKMKAVFTNPPKAPVDCAVADGEELPFGGGIIVIATPGHTPGHICLYHRPSRTLIAGDAMNIVDGRLTGPNPANAFDLDLAIRSLKKLAKYDIEKIICYHGGLYSNDANRAIAELIA